MCRRIEEEVLTFCQRKQPWVIVVLGVRRTHSHLKPPPPPPSGSQQGCYLEKDRLQMYNQFPIPNIAENNSNKSISELDLCILVADVYSEFQLKMSMNDRDIEWQPELI